ncbi:unnamed protein product [Gongylonema pulchrum]|uniref:CASP C-terminal domain-containing protein n=1 Tax=Gongylonema pulchrum TaxID=637853 RepID=A0A3P7R409_9BILA|nr:unnamed protein product [Gongylonema pulchrum]
MITRLENDLLSLHAVLPRSRADRDRLHYRVDELEQELSIQKQNNAYLQSERDKILEDNVQLYGKIKFLQSYQNKNREVLYRFAYTESCQRDFQTDCVARFASTTVTVRVFLVTETQQRYGLSTPDIEDFLVINTSIAPYDRSLGIFMTEVPVTTERIWVRGRNG